MSIHVPVALPASDQFLLFGMGPHRPKLVYQDGCLRNARTGEVVHAWTDVVREEYEPWEYRVRLTRADGAAVSVYEDTSGLWIWEAERQPQRVAGAAIPALPRFEGNRHAPLLRALHHELLTNIAEAERGGAPLPNLFVYDRPWFRDAAMVALCLKRTGNLALLEAWGRSLARLDEPFDRNNAGHREPDNLGQLLTLVALTGGDANHPLVGTILKTAEQFRHDDHLAGLSDFAPHPVYQTKWLKYGLRRLGLDDSRWVIPAVFDGYSALFWMDYRNRHVSGPAFDEGTVAKYPYLGWAEAHFHRTIPSPVPPADAFPLTWEAEASQADYAALLPWSRAMAWGRLCAPHTWHAAEMFLCLLDLASKTNEENDDR